MENLELKCSELVEELEKLGLFGVGYFSGVLAENRPALAKELYAALEVNFQELGIKL